MVRIIEKYLDPILHKLVYESILKTPMKYSESSNRGEDKFFRVDFDFNDNLTKYLCMKVRETLKVPTGFIKVYANIQFKEMHGNFHVDSGDSTVMIMMSDTLKKGDGCFVTKEKRVNFVQNRCIIFNAAEEHKGLASTTSTKPRVTLVFKTKKV